MSRPSLQLARFGRFSIFGKCLAMVAVITALVAGLMTFNAGSLLRDVATSGLRSLALDATQSLAREVSGALKFGKDDAVIAAFDAIIQREGDKLTFAVTYDLSGVAGNQSGHTTDAVLQAAPALVAKALQSGTIETDESGLIVAAPAIFGERGEVSGIVVTQWTTAGLEAAYGAQLMRAAGVAVIAFLLLMSVGAWFLHRTLRAPLKAVGLAMGAVASEDYETAIPFTARQDEVGTIANALDIMRLGLGAAEVERRAREREVQSQNEVVAALSSGLQKLATGDITVRMPATFPDNYRQLAEDYDTAMVRLGTALHAVTRTADKIGAEASDINRQSDDLSQRTENQAATLEETAAALAELTANVAAAASGARQVEQVVQEAQADVGESGTIVLNAVGAMQEIQKFSDQISAIISVIDDIAFQTNLLALNAGVEAARAGEAGRGFAVVASEVRALAQRSSDAAREIKSLINGSVQQVAKGVDLVGKAGQALSIIVDRVQNISVLITGITQGVVAQSVSLNEINIGVSQLDQVTQKNAAMVQDANQASGSLSREARELVGLVSVFKADPQQVQMASPHRAPAPFLGAA
jgi:methyl-accepting chemotaxis protein